MILSINVRRTKAGEKKTWRKNFYTIANTKEASKNKAIGYAI